MQAVILVGGEGTRLRPLTSTVPKPVVPLVDRPFIAYMLEWLARHGVDDVVMSCGFLATAVRNVLGDGSQYGLRLRFVEEPEPRGTAGALKYAEDLLDERFLMLNGDVLTDIDLTAQIAQHEATGAVGTLALVPVGRPDRLRPRAPATTTTRSRSSSRSRAPTRSTRSSSRPAPTCSSARCSTSSRPTATSRSSARCGRSSWATGLFGFAAEAYWLDIGTPERYLQGTFDILEGNVAHGRGRPPRARLPGRRRPRAGATAASCRRRSSSAAARSRRARTSARSSCSARACSVGEGATIERSVVLNGAEIGAGLRAARLHRRRRRAHRRGLGDLRRRRARRGRDGRGSATSCRAACESSRRRTCPKAPSRSEEGEADLVQHRAARARPRDDRPGRSDRPAHRRPRHPRAPARRAVEGRVGRPGALGLARTASSSRAWAARPSAATWPARSSATTPRARCSARAPTACRRGRRPTRPSCARRYSGNTEETLACYEAAGRDRRPARRRHQRRQARRARARRPGARHPGRRRLPAARRGRLHDGRRAARSPRCAASARGMNSELDVAADHLEELVIEWGPEGAARRAGQEPRPRAARHRAGGRRRRADDADRLPLEDPGQRERQDARPTRSSCPSSTTTRSWAGARRSEFGRFSRRLPRRLPTPIRASRSASTSPRG